MSTNNMYQQIKSTLTSKELMRWAVYSVVFAVLLIPFTLPIMQNIAGGMILGFFAGSLNRIQELLAARN